MLDTCLNKIGPNVSELIKSDKELYYSEVKHFIKIIKWTKEQHLRELERNKFELFGQTRDVEMKDEETKQGPHRQMSRKLDGEFRTVNPEFSKYRPDTLYPSLQNLESLLTIDLIRDYPKLSLLAYEALHEYIDVFDNTFVSFLKQCERHKLIENIFKKRSNSDQSLMQEQLQKRVKIVESGGLGRDAVISFYIKQYKRNLEGQASDKNRLDER